MQKGPGLQGSLEVTVPPSPPGLGTDGMTMALWWGWTSCSSWSDGALCLRYFVQLSNAFRAPVDDTVFISPILRASIREACLCPHPTGEKAEAPRTRGSPACYTFPSPAPRTSTLVCPRSPSPTFVGGLDRREQGEGQTM